MRPSDIRRIAPSLSGLWRNLNLLLNFDARWYAAAYQDVPGHRLSPLMHFVRYGLPERRSPSAWFNTAKFPETTVPRKFSEGHTTARSALAPLDVKAYSINYLRKLHASDDLLVFFNVTTKELSGGMLSIDRFANLALELTQDQPDAAVAVSGVPLDREPVHYSLFEPCLPMTHFAYIVKNTSPTRVRLFVPEVFADAFITMILANATYRHWLKERPRLGIVILNQNISLMPAPQPFVSRVTELTMDVMISTAHPRYCTGRLATEYGLPVKQLTPLLPDMPHRSWVNRKSVFMVSPDVLNDTQSGLTQDLVVERLKAAFPEFEFVVITKMKLQHYLDLASRVRFALTFGEGMDGYFIEPVLSGGVSFAVYNDVFFPPQFKDAPTVATNWPELLDLIEQMVPRLQADPELYDRISCELQDRLARTYSREISKSDLGGLLEGRVDHQPTAKARQPELFENLRIFLEAERGFRFHNGLPGDKQVVVAPDGLIVQHFGSEFYSVLYEIYERRDYDLNLDADTDYVLVDIGANVGMASLYLRNKYRNIREIYAYEPLIPVARVARENIVANVAEAPIHLKQVALSDRFEIATFQYFSDWTTAFSIDSRFLDSWLGSDEGGSRVASRSVEVEIVPADLELAEIVQNLGTRRLAIKCDTQGSEFAIFDALDASGQLSFVDVVVVETHFKRPDAIIETLTRNGFVVQARLDSEENCVYTVKAERPGSLV